VIAKGAASSATDAAPLPSLVSSARRVGSANAANVRSSCCSDHLSVPPSSGTIWFLYRTLCARVNSACERPTASCGHISGRDLADGAKRQPYPFSSTRCAPRETK
jgi:hypothetical protein